MMHQPLVISSLLTHAERHHGQVEVVTRRVEGDIHRYRFVELARRSRQLAKVLQAIDVQPGDRVGTLAWNTYRHLELYYAVSGSGAILHTINPRLHEDQVAYIAEHADDRVVFFDLSFLRLVESIAPRLPQVRHWVALCDAEDLPHGGIEFASYETLLAQHDDRFQWPLIGEEEASSLCYTSGTTGNPKGVLYSHRSTLLHLFAMVMFDGLNITGLDTVLPAVPMFHVNAWGIPYAACMLGTKLVLPGPALDGASLHALFESEGVTVSAGVPSVWQGVLAHVDAHGLRFNTLKRLIVGGSACSLGLMHRLQDDLGVTVQHAWGMTELSPLGVSCTFKPKHAAMTSDERYAVQVKQGHAVFGVDMKVVDERNNELPWDGQSAGEIHVRGPWVASSYFRAESGSPLVDGWFPTGDIGTVDPDGYMQLTDRSKDAIKSGGEWISSIDLENIAMAHPGVSMAACIAMPHAKWDERPLLLVVRKPRSTVSKSELLKAYEGKVAKWWVPDEVSFVESIPLGATGKVLKSALRQALKSGSIVAGANGVAS